MSRRSPALLALLLLSSSVCALPRHLTVARPPVAPVPGVVTHGSRLAPEVALTFDADMTPGMEGELRGGKVKSFDNVAVRRILDATHTPATFFFTGMWAQVYPQAAREIAQNPLFEVEDHSYDHPGFAQPCYGLASIAEADKAADIERSQRAIEAATGKTPRYFRFPGGCALESDVQLAHSLGLTTVHWDVISGDAGQSNPAVIIRNVLGGVRDGSIVVMHSHGGKAPATALALPAIIAGLKAKGFTLVTVEHLLGH